MCKRGTNMPNIGQSRPVVLTSTTRSSGPVVCGKSAEVSVEIAVSWNKMQMETNQETKRQTNEQAMERIQEHEMSRKYSKRKRDPQEGGDRTIILNSVESYGLTSYRTLQRDTSTGRAWRISLSNYPIRLLNISGVRTYVLVVRYQRGVEFIHLVDVRQSLLLQ